MDSSESSRGGEARRVAVLGTGSVGTALARGFAAAGGYDLVLGSRSAADPGADLAALAEETGADLATPAEAAGSADVVVLAVPGTAVVDVARDLAATLAGRVVLDATNGRVPDGYDSIAEAVAAAAPDAHVAKAFNTIGANRMTDPTFPDGTASMFVCGDAPATAVAAELAASLGFDVVEAGDLAAAGHLESLAWAWIHLSRLHGRDVGFRLLGVEAE
jgi:hypothetical protein